MKRLSDIDLILGNEEHEQSCEDKVAEAAADVWCSLGGMRSGRLAVVERAKRIVSKLVRSTPRNRDVTVEMVLKWLLCEPMPVAKGKARRKHD